MQHYYMNSTKNCLWIRRAWAAFDHVIGYDTRTGGDKPVKFATPNYSLFNTRNTAMMLQPLNGLHLSPKKKLYHIVHGCQNMLLCFGTYHAWNMSCSKAVILKHTTSYASNDQSPRTTCHAMGGKPTCMYTPLMKHAQQLVNFTKCTHTELRFHRAPCPNIMYACIIMGMASIGTQPYSDVHTNIYHLVWTGSF